MSIRMQVFSIRNERNPCTFTPLQSKALKCWPMRGYHMDSPGSMMSPIHVKNSQRIICCHVTTHGSMGPLCQLNHQETCHARRRGTRAHMEVSLRKHRPDGRPGASAGPRIDRTDLGSVDLPFHVLLDHWSLAASQGVLEHLEPRSKALPCL
jgi:hypothetical protein